jgi:pimeloyl-ACP methyl ester carboxylesterase
LTLLRASPLGANDQQRNLRPSDGTLVTNPINAGDPLVRRGVVPGAPRLAFDRTGHGELVIFLHGVGGNRRNWASQLPAFAQRFQAVAWDARGYGDSDDYEGQLAFTDFADDLLRLLDHLEASQAHVVGLSMGGNIAMDFAVRFSDRVRSLVLCDTDRGMTHFSEQDRRQFLRLRRDPLLANRAIADIVPTLVESLSGPFATDASREALAESLLLLHRESYIKSVEATVDFDIRHAIHEISCPTLVLVGEFDRLTPLEEAQAIATAIPGARLVVIPRAGHLSNIEEPEVFNREVLNFLSGVIA